MPFVFTAAMQKRLSPRVRAMLDRSISFFPELKDRTITVGVTRANLGSAVLARRGTAIVKLTIRLNVRALSFQTVGHELTHLAQGVARASLKAARGRRGLIPAGEKQCDVWTLARSRLFCDEPPTYLRLPKQVRADWSRYAGRVRALCIAAIARRKRERFYIRWLESEIAKLGRERASPRPPPAQLSLPFAS
ncbi:MAG TPA: hypothetical protein VNL14_05040 [Candidatus Acidoferrales bacterium]|nr:hypothetical protein [Candidatus Acidoferrales bacterium]